MARSDFTVILPDSGNVDPGQLAEFLYLFRGAYAAAVEGMQAGRSAERVAEGALAHLRGLDSSTIDGLFVRDLGRRNLEAKRLSHESPTTIIFVGVAVAVAAAAILSGGKLKAGIFAAELAPLGDGIKKLREAFTRSTKARIGYGLRGRSIKLSRDEFEELMRHDPRRRDRGGFQRFLIGLQYRINAQTRVLHLTDSDIDRIIKHGRRASAGGWQKSIRVIFEEHFDLDGEA